MAMKATVVAEGLQFPEGPTWLGLKRVAVTQIRGQCVSLWENGRLTKIADTGGGANGATLGPDGALYVANNGGVSLGHEGHWLADTQIAGRIQCVTLEGEVRDVATALPGTPPNRPNDLCFGRDAVLADRPNRFLQERATEVAVVVAIGPFSCRPCGACAGHGLILSRHVDTVNIVR